MNTKANYYLRDTRNNPLIWEVSVSADGQLSCIERFTFSVLERTVYVMSHQHHTFTMYQVDDLFGFGELRRVGGPELPTEVESLMMRAYAAYLLDELRRERKQPTTFDRGEA